MIEGMVFPAGELRVEGEVRSGHTGVHTNTPSNKAHILKTPQQDYGAIVASLVLQ